MPKPTVDLTGKSSPRKLSSPCKLMAMRWLGWLLIPIALTAADWTQFRGPNGAGVSPSKDLPERFDAHCPSSSNVT